MLKSKQVMINFHCSELHMFHRRPNFVYRSLPGFTPRAALLQKAISWYYTMEAGASLKQ
jgi:hypothetical protein